MPTAAADAIINFTFTTDIGRPKADYNVTAQQCTRWQYTTYNRRHRRLSSIRQA
jgi:hypothetical protein